MCAYMVCITRNVHARVMEAENSITLTIYTGEKHIYSSSERIMVFMSILIHSAGNKTLGFPAPGCMYDSVAMSTFVIKLLRQC